MSNAHPVDATRRPRPLRWLAAAALGAIGLAVAGALLAALAFALVYVNLPPIDALADYRPRIPLRVWTADNVLIGEFGEERRDFVRIEDVPPAVKLAVLAAEDDRFYRHSGVDYTGLARAAVANVLAGRRGQGGSTITMQVARNFFLSSERSYLRKLYEIALAYKIEATLPKDRILEIYLNQIFLGQRAYGFGAAARIYFGKKLGELSVAEAAMLAGLPVAPSAYNPAVNPRRAQVRQQYVLGRMLQLGFIDQAQYDAALAEELKTRAALAATEPAAGARLRGSADFAAEMARQLMFEVFREETYSRGLNVYTTLIAAEQQAAYTALRTQVLDYDRRYGYRGPEAFVDLSGDAAAREQRIDDALVEAIDSPGLVPAVVLEAAPEKVVAVVKGGERLTIEGGGLRFAARALNPKAQPAQRIVPGAVIRVARLPKDGWEIVQLPQVEALFVAANAADGAVRALVGGFDFNLNKFNHVTQGWRQPGSSFKPFIYSAALEQGFTPSTVVNDAPIYVDPAQTGGQLWEPKNFEGKNEGPMRLRQALAKSKNLVSIRVLQTIGPASAQQWATRFGFDADKHPPYLTLALGAGSVTAWQMLAGYNVFANGGHRVTPYLIARVTDANGKVLMEAPAPAPLDEANRAIPARNAWLTDNLLRDVTRYGTAARAGATLKRADLAGKTGTTNDSHDAWFAGYGGGIVGVAWMGFDQPRPLGTRETGGGLALPIWIGYMQTALKGRPEEAHPMPEGLVVVGSETYFEEFPPGSGIASVGLTEQEPPAATDATAPAEKKPEPASKQIF
ncbi:MAG: penicillin-binding protein 1A [Betaproteobacteria bacterium]